MLIATAVAVVLREWIGSETAGLVGAAGLVVFLVLAAPTARWSRKAFVAIGLALIAIAVLFRHDWPQVVMKGLEEGSFISTFFIALASLRNPASTSPAIERCGQYLASQPPGKRYMALTIGGHLFALILSYGSITLLGGLTESIANREKNAEIGAIRNRRMLLAIQRGFCASLLWSPLAFAIAISTSIVPGSSWSGVAGLALCHAALMTAIGWGLDTVFKPKLTAAASAQAAADRRPIGSWRDLQPLVLLLALLFSAVGTIELLTGIRVIGVVMLIVPLISLGWIAIQVSGGEGPRLGLGGRLTRLAFTEIPSYRSELLLLVMAGVIGAVGGALLKPLTAGHAIDFGAVPPFVILVAMIWIVPLLGQAGMNPILSVSLLAPLLPSPTAMGVSPNVVVLALTAGWSLAGATSPFTATTLLIGRLGHTTALKVGLVWNRSFVIAAGLALSLSVAIASVLI
ncbi:hypothetical protein [Jiella sp. M17.18]|uniref:hypothetical protein n=1 Tax=Jiella sp. M17.18 TaxID=3234247 RepID=UPI0034E012CF